MSVRRWSIKVLKGFAGICSSTLFWEKRLPVAPSLVDSHDCGREDGEIDHSRSPDAGRGREDPDRERPSAPAHHGKAELTARQRARMADASLLLDVLLKTSSRRCFALCSIYLVESYSRICSLCC